MKRSFDATKTIRVGTLRRYLSGLGLADLGTVKELTAEAVNKRRRAKVKK